jgi:hypothetical protein
VSKQDHSAKQKDRSKRRRIDGTIMRVVQEDQRALEILAEHDRGEGVGTRAKPGEK